MSDYGSSPVGPSGYGSSGMLSADTERTMAVVAHLSAIIAMVLSAGWLSFVGPLIVWALYKERSPFVRHAAAGSFNFNLWAWVMSIVAWICLITVVLFPVAIILWVVAGVMTLWCHLHGALRASRLQPYRYPTSIPILR